MSNSKMRSWVLKITVLMLFVSLVGVLVACSKNANRDKEIQIFTQLSADGSQVKELQKIVDEFNAQKTTDKKAVLVNNTDPTTFDTNMQNDIPNGRGGDMYFTFANSALDYVDTHILRLDTENGLDLDEIVSRTGGLKSGDTFSVDNVVSDALRESLSQPGHSGELYSVPLHESGPMMYFNKKIFDELELKIPTSWAELETVGKIIKEKKDIPMFAPSAPIDFYQTLLVQSGVNYITVDSAGKATVAFDNETDRAKIIGIFKYVKRNMDAGIFQFQAAAPAPNSSTLLMEGKIASYQGSNSHESTMTNSDAAKEAVESGKFELLVGKNLQGGINLDGTGGEVGEDGQPVSVGHTLWTPAFNRQIFVTKSNEARQAGAIEFIKFFTTKEINARWAAANTVVSPFKDARDQQVFKDALAKSQAMNVAIESKPMTDSNKITIFGGKSQIRNATANQFKKVVDKESEIEESGWDGVITALITELKNELK